MSWRLCLCLAVVATALPFTLSSPTVTPNSGEQQKVATALPFSFSSPKVTPNSKEQQEVATALPFAFSSPTVTPNSKEQQKVDTALPFTFSSPTVTPNSKEQQKVATALPFTFSSPTVTQNSKEQQKVATALPLLFTSPTVTPNSNDQQTDIREASTEFSSTGTNQVLQNVRNGHQSEEDGSLMKKPGADMILADSEEVRDNDVDDDAGQDAEYNHLDYNNIEEDTTQTSDYENALAAFPGVVSILHDPDTYNWLLSYLPVKLPKLPETFSLKSEYKNVLYGYLKSANRVVVGNDHIRNAINSTDWLFKGYNDSQVCLYFKLALDASQDYYENTDGAALRDRLDRVLRDFEDEEFQRRMLERLDWWTPLGAELWDQVSRVSQYMGWTSSEGESSVPATVRHTYKKWSDTLKEYMNEGQSWTSRANTFIQSSGRLLLPNVNFATVSDHAATNLLTCAGCASKHGTLNVNLANIFFFLSALLTPLLLLALPIALAVWLAIVYGIKFKYLAHGSGGGGYGGGHGGGGGGGYGYSDEGGHDDNYRRSGDTSTMGNLAEGIGNMMADSFINWGGVDSPRGGSKKKVVRVSGNRSRYSEEYATEGQRRRGEAYGGGGERLRPKTKYRRRSKPKVDTVYYDDYEDYYVEDRVIS